MTPITTTTPTMPSSEPHTLQCMEVWGGNDAVQSAVKMPGLDAWVYSRPHKGEASGGDVHYLSSCATGRITRLLIADVSGHGLGVSEIAIRLRDLMRQFVNYLDQTRFVESLNREFNGQESGSFATAVLGTYWAPTRYLVACNAGHPRPIRFHAATGEWTFIGRDNEESSPAPTPGADTPTNLPLGVLDVSRYDQLGVRLDEGDVIILYTDSLIEAKDAEGKLLGEPGLLEFLRELGAGDPATLASRTIARAESFNRGLPLDDDATMLVMRCNTERTRRGPRESFAAAWYFLGLVIVRLRGGTTPIPWPELRLANIGGAILPWLNRLWGRDAAK
ncbi:MAG: serine/threonine-protein phosphatase [Phycisphaerales bacterium]|jgi:sigma-B regulation protein RsbU (phosphoserine phosphatase)|nr:serine/threonine-protein phosphatase [Phycisphaerales bacterium]